MIHFPKIGVWSTWRTSGMPNGEKFTHKEAFNNYLDKDRGRGVNRKSTTGHLAIIKDIGPSINLNFISDATFLATVFWIGKP